MTVEDISEAQVPFVLSLERERIGSSLGREEIERALSRDGYICLVASEGGADCGYILASLSGSESEIYSVAVPADMEGKGIGRLLVSSLLERLKDLGVNRVLLEVEIGNERAYSLYRNSGFTEYRRRKGYYGEGDAICMERRLRDEL